MTFDERDAGPARLSIHTFELFVLGIVGDGRQGGFALPCDLRNQVGCRNDAVAQEEDHGAWLKLTRCLLRVTDGHNGNAVRAEAFEGFVQHGWDAFDENDDRLRVDRSGATHLIFEQGLTGEREQGTKPSLIILLIGRDQRA